MSNRALWSFANDAKPDPRIRLIEEIGRWKVYLVNGRKARQWYKDFTQGANFMAYAEGSRFAERSTAKFPKDEIWVEQLLDPDEEPFCELHELHETCDMIEYGFGYEHAHELANDYEFKARDNPERLAKLLENERKRCLRIQDEHNVVQDAATDLPKNRAHTITIELSDGDHVQSLARFLREVAKRANNGHSFSLEADRREGGDSRNYPTAEIDGDGADHFGRVLLDGKEVELAQDESPEEDRALWRYRKVS